MHISVGYIQNGCSSIVVILDRYSLTFKYGRNGGQVDQLVGVYVGVRVCCEWAELARAVQGKKS